MKNILVYLLLFFNISCSSNVKREQSTETIIDCPQVFFASNHRNYIDSEEEILNLDNLSFKAEINNFAFNKSCVEKDNIHFFPLDLLFLVNPIKSELKNVELPFYIALMDSKNQLIEMQYYSINASLNYDLNYQYYNGTELIKSLNILTKHEKVSSIVIGFMLDKTKNKLLN